MIGLLHGRKSLALWQMPLQFDETPELEEGLTVARFFDVANEAESESGLELERQCRNASTNEVGSHVV